jgi:hypothetical protein
MAFSLGMRRVCFTLPLAVEHALLAEAVLARASANGLTDPSLEFEDCQGWGETRITCSAWMAAFILEELHRIEARAGDDVELSFALT